jgi:hypothetical protein
MRLIQNVGGWLRRQIVQPVPPDIAMCEFGCRKPQCRTGEWEACERRRHGVNLTARGSGGSSQLQTDDSPDDERY